MPIVDGVVVELDPLYPVVPAPYAGGGPSTAVEVPDPDVWPSSDDPLDRNLVRDDVVEQTVKRIQDSIEKQFAHHVSRAEWAEVITRLQPREEITPVVGENDA